MGEFVSGAMIEVKSCWRYMISNNYHNAHAIIYIDRLAGHIKGDVLRTRPVRGVTCSHI